MIAFVLEVDATGISSKQGKGKWIKPKLAIVYTGKKLCSNNSKVPCYELIGKKIFASINNIEIIIA